VIVCYVKKTSVWKKTKKAAVSQLHALFRLCDMPSANA